MTPALAVANVVNVSFEPGYFAKVIAALCNLVPADRWMRHEPVTPEEIQFMLSCGQTNFAEVRGRFISVRVNDGVLDVSDFARIHGMKNLDDALADVAGCPNIRV